MKNIFKYMAGVLVASFAMTACSPEEFTGANGNIPQVSDYADNFKVTVDQETNYAKFEFTSAPGITPVWIIDGTTYSSAFSLSKYYRKKGSYTVECKVKNADGFSDGVVTKNFVIEKTKMVGFGGFVEDSEYNLFKRATFADPTFLYFTPTWDLLPAPAWSLKKGIYTVQLPSATIDRWQAQMFINTGVGITAGVKYDFSVILTSSKAHSGVKVKICQADKDDVVLMDKDVALAADEPKCIWGSNLEGVDMSNVRIVLDFGRNAADTEINIESFVLKDHANDDKTEVPNEVLAPFNYNDAGNIWKAVDADKAFTESTYFGDENWGDIACNPIITHDGNKHSITVPVATNPAEIWRAQWHIFTNLSATANDVVDFSVKVNTTAQLPGLVVKLTEDGDDDNFFFAVSDAIPAGDYVFRKEGVKLSKDKDASKLKIDFGFGGAPVDAVITLSEITIIKK